MSDEQYLSLILFPLEINLISLFHLYITFNYINS